MGKKGSWFSAIKRVFLPHSKDKLANEPDKKSSSKEKKSKGIGKFRQGESSSSFIPLFREPSSIEKILGEAEREHKLTFRPPTHPAEQPRTPNFVPPPSRVVSSSPRVPSLRVSSSPRAATSPRAPSPRPAASPRPPSPKAAAPSISARATSPKNVERERQVYRRIEPTLRNQNACATKIQAAYRGYMARRSFRALKGLVRLQGVIRGQNVKRQTMNAMKCMQLLVRVQSQIQSRRIQMLENQARQHKKNDNEVESHLGKRSQTSEAGNVDDWDDSVLTKDQVEAGLRSKMDAVIKRERSMAYAYSHQLWKGTPRATQLSLTDIRSNGFPWWWNWLERQLPASSSNNNKLESQPTKNFQLTPTRPSSQVKPSPVHQQHFAYDGMDTPTSRSTRSTGRQVRTPVHKMTPNNNAANSSAGLSKYSRARGGGGGDHSSPSPFNFPSKDDDSLTSCPPFSRPNYMTPTVSAKAKTRANSNPRESFPLPGTPSSEKRRVSFPFGGGQSFKWNAGSLFSSNNNKGSGSPRVIDKHQPIHSIGNLSVDSTVSMPAAVGRRPFNRRRLGISASSLPASPASQASILLLSGGVIFLTAMATENNSSASDVPVGVSMKLQILSEISTLGDDLLIEILIRLPSPKFACRISTVCKRWSSLISSPRFNRSFVSHHESINELHPPLVLSSEDQQSIIQGFVPMPSVDHELRFAVLDSFQDLLLCGFQMPEDLDDEFRRSYFVCNPFTKQWIALPLAPCRPTRCSGLVARYTSVLYRCSSTPETVVGYFGITGCFARICVQQRTRRW
ncbi:unnamed protein product [Linum trigynum]|uniref:F-box domain-containing protein n=1 Tax=Linum trigynum TaxID=586398 RepID=A0AAV2D2L2_9ROSI